MTPPESADASWLAWLKQVVRGPSEPDSEFAQKVFVVLQRIAARRLGDMRLRSADEEDLAQSAMASFCGRVADGQFAQIASREEFWKLLATIVHRKTSALLRRHGAKKRGGLAVRGDSYFLNAPGESQAGTFEQVAANTPDPSEEAAIFEQFQYLFQLLEDDTLKQVASLKLEGLTDQQVADRLGCVTRTVERKLARIRTLWSKELIHDNRSES